MTYTLTKLPSPVPDIARHFIGRDPFARWSSVAQTAGSFPPYDIEQIDEDNFRLTLAIAGFAKEEVELSRERDVLTIKGSKTYVDDKRNFLHRGIALRDFERKFVLGEHIVVRGATMADGILVVDLVREVPESARAITIQID